MNLRKPKVKIKKTSKPKATTRIVSKVTRASMPNIQLPEMGDMQDGLAGGIGGIELMPDLGKISVIGSGQTIGNDFKGSFYDLKRNRQGGGIPMDQDQFRLVIRDFIRGGWKESDLNRYYRAPKTLYTTHFVVPPIPAPLFPDLYGAPEAESYFFFVKYKGELVYKEDIKFRFWGIGNAYMMVRVNGTDVFMACWPFHEDFFDWWQSSSPDNRKYFLADQEMAVGDWITLKAGQPVEMEVLFGEWEGWVSSAILLVEVEGQEYPRGRQGGPILPAFRTEDFSLDMLEEITKYLPEGECSLTNGPVFRDF
jgi:hypothetical protein